MRMNEPHKSWTETSAKSPPWTRFVSRVVFPLHEKLKGHDSVARLHALERSQWWRIDDLERHRLARLKDLLAYAGRHVPYYRSLFKEIDFDPVAMTSVADLQRLPLLTKPLIRANDLKSEIAGPAAGLLHGPRAHQPRRCGQMARNALVAPGHR